MMSFAEPKLEIVQCDNGYVVEWRKERDKNSVSYSVPDTSPPTSGVRIFKSKKEVVSYLTDFFAGA